jgi:lipopolysaccharide export system permease protein
VNTFDRHLLREWLQILGLVLAATCGLLLLQVLYDDFRDLRELGARGAVLWTYLVVTVPSFLAIVLQLSLLVSLLFVLGKLHRANELTVMRAAGVGFMRLTAPIWVVGLLCCGLMWWLNTTVVPWSVERKNAMYESLQFKHESTKGVAVDHIGAIYDVAFDNQIARRMWFFNRYSKAAQRGYGVSVSELDPQRREVRRILAEEGWRDPRRGWMFARGRELTFAPESGELTSSVGFTERVVANYKEDPELMLLVDRKPSDLTIFQLERVIDHLETEHSPKVVPYAVRYFGLIADTLGPLIIIAIAIPFAVAGVRVNPAVGVSKSLGLFFLYYLLSTLATTLASRDVISPLVAAWLPNCGMGLLALWFFARLR